MEKESILVSACLLGVPCRYDGASKPCSAVERLRAHYRLIPICPEQSGGLPTPRPASEIGTDGRVRNHLGADVTAEYLAGAGSGFAGGAGKRLPFGGSEGKSPSCGVGKVYDGSFSGKLVTGDGITVRLLQKHGIRVIGESEIPGIIREKVV